MIRAFIAISCPEEIRGILVEIQNQIKPVGKIKLVGPNNIHLTLKFLGNITEEYKDKIIRSMDKISNTDGFSISLERVGVFPGASYPRVIWIGVGRGRGKIQKLHDNIDQELNAMGFEKDKRFSTHFTIARVKTIEDRVKFTEILDENSKKEFGNFFVSSIDLMKSELKRTGPVYSMLHRSNFA